MTAITPETRSDSRLQQKGIFGRTLGRCMAMGQFLLTMGGLLLPVILVVVSVWGLLWVASGAKSRTMLADHPHAGTAPALSQSAGY